MHKLRFLNYIPLLLAAACSLPIACGSDDEGVPEDVRTGISGNYFGTINCVCRLSLRDTLRVTSAASVSGKSLHIEALPVAAVVDSVLGKGTAAEDGITSVPFNMNYTLYNAGQAYYPMAYDPQPVSLTAEKNGQVHDITIYFAGKGSDFEWYYPQTHRIEMALTTKKILLDGEPVTGTATYPDSIQDVVFRFPFILHKQ